MTIKAAVITDVHANLPALDAALAAIARESCDVVYCLGDVIGIGPFPAECLTRLLDLPAARFVMGNHDALFAFGFPDPRPAWLDDGEAEHQRWTHAQLSPALKEVVARWPYRHDERFGPAPAIFCHYALDQSGMHFKDITPSPSDEELDRLFAAPGNALVFYGHYHEPSDRTSNARYVNPGSLGCSFDALARFVIVEEADDGAIAITHHAAPYDRANLIREFEARRVPEREMILRSFYGVN